MSRLSEFENEWFECAIAGYRNHGVGLSVGMALICDLVTWLGKDWNISDYGIMQ